MNENSEFDELEIINIFKRLIKENRNVFIKIKNEMITFKNKACK